MLITDITINDATFLNYIEKRTGYSLKVLFTDSEVGVTCSTTIDYYIISKNTGTKLATSRISWLYSSFTYNGH